MIATYRLQLRPGFGFAEVRQLLPYFQRLGVSHLYLSPVTEARAGSTHGYDVADHNRIRAELGGREAFDELLEAVRAAGMYVILDFVPNHADAGAGNVYWQDVLAYGPYSPYARYFDIEWDPLKPELRRKILLPFLGRPYGEALDRREITLSYADGRFSAAYYDHAFALNPATYGEILDAMASSGGGVGDLARAHQALPADRRDELEALRPHLTGALRDVPVDALLTAISGEGLHALLQRQFWRLAFWKTAGYEINYRRFFYVNDLVALRVEDADVFVDVHRLLATLIGHPAVAGVRVDHVDGLVDPHTYLERLRALGTRGIWVEKILAPGETLPEEWPVEGTTGYDFLNDVLGALTWAGSELSLDRTYRRFVRDRPPYRVEVYRSKRYVMQHHLSGELFRLAYDLDRVSEADYHTRDFSFEALREALLELLASLDRYRTYLPRRRDEAAEILREALYRARQRNPGREPGIFSFVLGVMLGDVPEQLALAAGTLAARVQQYASVVAAKGVEDTAFYRYVRLAAANEVGGEPDRVGLPADAFHARARFRAMRYPCTLLATATHDHKRGEDTRMRLAVLAELSREWQDTLSLLRPLLRRHSGPRDPAAADIYLFLQTLAALWEDGDRAGVADRLAEYMRKAAREASLLTGWTNPDTDYEGALEHLIRGVIGDRRLVARIGPLARALARYGFVNGISQLVLKTTAPGVPDFYQGSELLELSLVDPDNRRPVDFARRQQHLDDLSRLLEEPDVTVLRGMLREQDERLKLYAMVRLLRLRRDRGDVFAGSYRPLAAEGSAADHVLAYARESEAAAIVVLVPRFPALLEAGGGYRTTRVILPNHLGEMAFEETLSGTAVAPGGAIDPGALPLPWGVLVSVQG